MQLKVLKSDGSVETYLHTKVMGAIAAALGDSGLYQEGITDHLAEAVTEYIANRYGSSTISTDEIHAMIEAVLSETGHYEAALALHEHRLTRQVKRSRTEVIHRFNNTAISNPLTSVSSKDPVDEFTRNPWNKSIIVSELLEERQISRPLARAVAGAVEEKVLRLQVRCVFSTLIRALVENELWTMRQTAASFIEDQARMDAQDPLCEKINNMDVEPATLKMAAEG